MAVLAPLPAAAQSDDPCAQIERLNPSQFPEIDELGERCVEALPRMSPFAQDRHIDFYVNKLPSYMDADEVPALATKLAPVAHRKLTSLTKTGEAVKGRLDMAEADRLIEAASAADDLTSLSHLYYAKGVQTARDAGPTEVMERHFRASLRFAKMGNVTAALPAIFNALAVRAKRDGETDTAVELYLEALAAYEGAGRFDKTGMIFTNIGNIFDNIGGSKEAIRFHSRAIESYKEFVPDDTYRLAGAYGNLGKAYYHDEQYDKAVGAYVRAKEYNDKEPTEFLIGHLELGHAEALYESGQKEAAIAMAERAIPLILETRDEFEGASGLLWVAQHYLDEDQTGKAKEALDTARTIIEPDNGGAEALTERPGDIALKLGYADLTARLLTRMGRPAEAAPYFLAAAQLNDVFFEDEKMRAIANTELLFDIRDRDRQLASLEQEAELSSSRLKQSQLAIGLMIALALLVGTVAYASFRSYRMQKALVKTRDLFLQEIHHRTGNNFQMMASLLRSEEKGAAPARSSDAGNSNSANRVRAMALVHQYLYNREGDASTEAQLDKFIVELLDLLEEGMGQEGIELRHDIASLPVDVSIATPLALLVCELVTNAYKHAFPEGEGVIDVSITSVDDDLMLSVSDNGSGFDHEIAAAKSGSQGMQLIEDLADQVGGEIGFKSGSDGTVWTVEKIDRRIKLAA
ncbi:histidine kinase dimerization/phosphoacceptor domain -containing protein [Erythrobacter rubeus]|uniref:histidine kinase n=1 Tax=Erythrobacter rubeus TaxID=2760803 RepID=A0ABR8KQI3_9SPHN|nr:histidine kinase dimerization/phosphoacceptor domain -containing protein [Erythrobacter rubeus]MBD2841308.1 ATP-binding protein [Erythrobacter rubeus]